MKRGLLSLIAWAAFSVAYWYVLHAYFRAPLDWMVPVAAGLLMAVAFGSLLNAIGSAVEALRSGRDSAVSTVIEPPKDGETLTVAGHIRAIGSSLRAPFSGKPAILYSYEVQHFDTRPNGSGVVKDYNGFALTPSAIDSPRGPIRILGFPMLEGFAKELIDSDLARSNAATYVRSTRFSDMGALQIGALYREMKDLMTDDDGQVRKDWKTGDETDFSDKNLYEQIVSPGEQVCVVGRYSAEKRGVVPDLVHGNVLRLMRGDAQMAAGSLWKKAASNLFSFAVVAVLVNGSVYSIMQKLTGHAPIAIPKTRATTRADKESYERAVRGGDIAAMEDLVVARGMPVDTTNDDGQSPLAFAPDAPTAEWLLAHGAKVDATSHKGQTPLMDQASAGNAAVVAVLVKAGANLDARSTEWKSTALTQALDSEKSDVVELLRKAGARDETVTSANGKPVSGTSEPARVCAEWLDAVQRSDVAALKRVSTFASFDGVDFNIWKSSRPVRVQSASGFANEEAATISVRGPIPDGRNSSTWTYQLVRRDGAWKISAERWETRLDGPRP
ncbi:MAG TPA: ankyrin repeat domain-containing protein [Thermoanaerobaculia bacterium]|nr:ankyrin repeat domain-containing protein [Thermoanaerobaculia bacterium]